MKRFQMMFRLIRFSPHSCILFSERNKKRYLIENFTFSKDIDTNASKKGTYDLFRAFAVEEVTIALNLLIDGDITARTFKAVKKDYEAFVSELYYMYIIKKEPCSYDLSGFDDSMGIFFTKTEIYIGILSLIFKKMLRKVTKIVEVKNDSLLMFRRLLVQNSSICRRRLTTIRFVVMVRLQKNAMNGLKNVLTQRK